MKITFVNHSSFIIEHEEVKLICDPWFEGSSFNNGWGLLSKTKMKYEDFKDITHIWFSHEHPDHFSPPNLMKIPKEIRAKITVLYQETTDKKVYEFCKKAGFKKQIELKENKFFKINAEFKIMCNPYIAGDSYALFHVGNYKVLNLNDCVVSSEQSAIKLRETIGEIDILFTQFGYAQKVGNINEISLRKASSEEKLQRINLQNRFLNPKIIIPFASFIKFHHTENKYMNEGMYKIDKVYDYINNKLNTKCIVMYPNDAWEPSESWDSKKSIEKYIIDYEKNPSGGFVISEPVIESTLIENSAFFLKKIKIGYPNRTRSINSLKANIFISDYEKSFELNGKDGLVKTNINQFSCDIILSSDSLNYCFKELWGFDTLAVNARYQETQKGEVKCFMNFGWVASNLNRKEIFPGLTLFNRIINKLLLTFNNKT
jgi:UDP-MurNAc hydroxylase